MNYRKMYAICCGGISNAMDQLQGGNVAGAYAELQRVLDETEEM